MNAPFMSTSSMSAFKYRGVSPFSCGGKYIVVTCRWENQKKNSNLTEHWRITLDPMDDSEQGMIFQRLPWDSMRPTSAQLVDRFAISACGHSFWCALAARQCGMIMTSTLIALLIKTASPLLSVATALIFWFVRLALDCWVDDFAFALPKINFSCSALNCAIALVVPSIRWWYNSMNITVSV